METSEIFEGILSIDKNRILCTPRVFIIGGNCNSPRHLRALKNMICKGVNHKGGCWLLQDSFTIDCTQVDDGMKAKVNTVV